MPITPRPERRERPPSSSALEKMRQITHGIIASREGVVGVVMVDLNDSQSVVVGSNPDFIYIDRLLEVSRTSAAMFRGADLKARDHTQAITGKAPEGPVVKSIQVESEKTVTISRLLDSHHDHMLMLTSLKSVPIGVALMTVKQACQELEPLLEQHLASTAASMPEPAARIVGGYLVG